MKSQNIILKDSFILNPNDSVYIHSAAYKHDFLQLLVAFPIASQFKLLYFNKDGKILQIKNLSLSLSSDSFLYLNENGIYNLNPSLKTLNFVKVSTSNFVIGKE